MLSTLFLFYACEYKGRFDFGFIAFLTLYDDVAQPWNKHINSYLTHLSLLHYFYVIMYGILNGIMLLLIITQLKSWKMNLPS